jgi:hypothetical protein
VTRRRIAVYGIALVLVGGFAAAAVPAMAEQGADGCGFPDVPAYRFVSASSVGELGGALGSVRPEVRHTYPGDTLAPSDYLKPMGPLGHYGLLGAWGPLGIAGPVGTGVWNPSAWISGVAGWSGLAEVLGWWNGPMSDYGPLGERGPLSEVAYCDTLPALGDPSGQTFSKQLQSGGLWGVLGPAGPFGALGPLGPLGVMGAHGLRWDRAVTGGFVDDQGAVVRAVSVPYGNGTRTYPLHEFYLDEQARAMTDNDTSFLVETTGMTEGSVVDYPFTSTASQWVTVLVAPGYVGVTFAGMTGCVLTAVAMNLDRPAACPGGAEVADDFDVEILDEAGVPVARSDSGDAVDWIQLAVPAGAKLVARVHYRGRASYPGLHDVFRLSVTGSTGYLPAGTDISGAHQRAGRGPG